MNRKLLAIAVLALASVASAQYQNSAYQAFQRMTYTLATSGTSTNGVKLIGTAVAYHGLIWNVTGSAGTCTVTLDKSTDNVTWSSGGVISAQNCAASGQAAIVNTVANYVRLTLNMTGSGTVVATYVGFVNNPSTGGGLAGLSATKVPKATSATTVGDGCMTDDGTTITIGCASGLSTSQATFTGTGAFVLQTEITDPGAPGAGKGSCYFSSVYQRLVCYNHNNGPYPVGTWGCTTQGGTIYGSTTVINGIYQEACLAGNTVGLGVYTQTSAGVPAYIAASNASGTEFQTSTGTKTQYDIPIYNASGDIIDSTLGSAGAIRPCYLSTLASQQIDNNSQTDITGATCTIPAGTLNKTTRLLHLYIAGTMTVGTNATNITVTGQYNGVTLCAKTSTTNTSASLTSVGWYYECLAYVQTAGTAAAFEINSTLTNGTTAVTNTVTVQDNTTATVTNAAFDTTANQTLKFRWTFGTGTTGNTIRVGIMKAWVENY